MVFLVNVHLFPGRAEINVRKRKKREKSRKIEKRERNGQQFCKLIVNNEERRPTFEKTTQFFFFRGEHVRPTSFAILHVRLDLTLYSGLGRFAFCRKLHA